MSVRDGEQRGERLSPRAEATGGGGARAMAARPRQRSTGTVTALAAVAAFALACGGTPELRVQRVAVPETPATERLRNVGIEREGLRATTARLLEHAGGNA